MTDTEILIVGGGIAGASAAFHLAAHGRRVTLLERGEIASGASGVNAGAIDSIGWGDPPDLQAHLTAGSVEIFKAVQLDHGEDIEFRRSGALQAIHTPEQHDFERERVQTLRARGTPGRVARRPARCAASSPASRRPCSAPCTRRSARRPIHAGPPARSPRSPSGTARGSSRTTR